MTSDIEKLKKSLKLYEKRLNQNITKKTEEALNRTVAKLKTQLSEIYNNNIRASTPTLASAPQARAQEIAEVSTLGKSKSIGESGEFYSDANSNIIKAHLVNTTSNKPGNIVSRVRSIIEEGDTYEDHLENFKSSILEKIFAIQQADGNYKYFVIPKGSRLEDDVMDNVKIFCSSYVDNTNSLVETDEGELVRKGTAEGRKKFERDKNRGDEPFTEFTLKEKAFKLIQERGTDITDIITNVQHGEYTKASDLAKQLAARNVANRQADYIDKTTTRMSKGVDLSNDQAALGKGNKRISGLTVKKFKHGGVTIAYDIVIKATGEEFSIDDTGQSGDNKWNLKEGSYETSTLKGADDSFPTKRAALASLEPNIQKENLLSKEEKLDKLAKDITREVAVWTKETKGVLERELSIAINKAMKEFNRKR